MGFFASYKRLTKRQKIALGVAGIVVGLMGPYYTTYLQTFFEEQELKNKQLKTNMKSAEQQRNEEARRQFELLKEKYEMKKSES